MPKWSVRVPAERIVSERFGFAKPSEERVSGPMRSPGGIASSGVSDAALWSSASTRRGSARSAGSPSICQTPPFRSRVSDPPLSSMTILSAASGLLSKRGSWSDRVWFRPKNRRRKSARAASATNWRVPRQLIGDASRARPPRSVQRRAARPAWSRVPGIGSGGHRD